MNFNLYLDDLLARALKRLARRRKVSRNALIREAVADLLEREERSEGWSRAVIEWRGEVDFEPFESHRKGLRDPVRDPLA